MALNDTTTGTYRVHGSAACGSAPTLHDYQHTQKVQGAPLHGHLDLQDCTHLILFNVHRFTVVQVWIELRATLRKLSQSIIQIKQVSNPNRNPQMDMWV